MLEFISGKGSRQEFQPHIGSFIDRAYIEPLHVKNNACQQIFRATLYESIGKSPLPGKKSFDCVLHSHPFSFVALQIYLV